ncbi:MAG: methyltransferase domain-containing protein [Candidatus Saccharimonadales bacterium]
MDNTEHTRKVQEQLKKHIADLGELASTLGNWPDYDDGVFYNKPSAKIAKPAIRKDFLLKQCKNKKVLHFGFADSPFTAERIKSGELLHIDIQKGAKEVWGADIDQEAIDTYRSVTGDEKNWTLDICEPIKNIGQYNKGFDVILFGEILEHLMSPGEALKNLRSLCELNDAELIITTPNAFTSVGFLAALIGNEVVHPEHYYYYSPVTLERLIRDCGFKTVEISFYAGSNSTTSPGLTFPGLIARCKA